MINRLGFNGEGHAAVHRRLADRKRVGVVGVNVGANKTSPDRTADYAVGIARFADVADYFTVNISSPNTPGLRDLHHEIALSELLSRIFEARDLARSRVPILLKIAPDLDEAALQATAEIALRSGVEGMVVSNTTVARDAIADDPLAAEAGGLSGKPLFRRSTVMLARVRRIVGRDMVLVGVGGVDSAGTVLDKLKAGANLVQFYTGMVYEGPGLPARILADLPKLLARDGAASISDLVGRDVEAWAAGGPAA